MKGEKVMEVGGVPAGPEGEWGWERWAQAGEFVMKGEKVMEVGGVPAGPEGEWEWEG